MTTQELSIVSPPAVTRQSNLLSLSLHEFLLVKSVGNLDLDGLTNRQIYSIYASECKLAQVKPSCFARITCKLLKSLTERGILHKSFKSKPLFRFRPKCTYQGFCGFQTRKSSRGINQAGKKVYCSFNSTCSCQYNRVKMAYLEACQILQV